MSMVSLVQSPFGKYSKRANLWTPDSNKASWRNRASRRSGAREATEVGDQFQGKSIWMMPVICKSKLLKTDLCIVARTWISQKKPTGENHDCAARRDATPRSAPAFGALVSSQLVQPLSSKALLAKDTELVTEIRSNSSVIDLKPMRRFQRDATKIGRRDL